MTPKQKRILFILAGANMVIALALAMLATRHLGPGDTPRPDLYTPAPMQQTCQWKATRLLARAGLSGTAAFAPAGPLAFEITYALPPQGSSEDAAQAVWTVFDTALTLQEQEPECATFTQVDVTIWARGSQDDMRIEASVSAADLTTFGAGELTEDQFIDRVTYSTVSEPHVKP
jgi:hypothetical protein